MLRSRGLAVVVLLTATSLLTLRLMGLSQWIQAILIIGVELLLGVVLHEMLEGRDRRERSRRSHRRRPSAHAMTHTRPHRAGEPYEARCRLLLPLRDDRPGLVEYALRECRSHRAGLDLLFLREPGPLGLGSKEADDDEARDVIERSRRRAERAGVPFRARYSVTHDGPRTIVAEANAREADLVVMAAPARDDIRAVLDALPDRVGLLVHA